MKSILKSNRDSDGGKGLLSDATDLIRRLDENCRRAQTVPEIFSPVNNALRLRLREVCEQLMLCHPGECGKKAEELMWKKIHYEPYSFSKQLAQDSGLDQMGSCLLVRHLQAGLGSYQQLLFSMETQLQLVDDRLDLYLCPTRGMPHETVAVRVASPSARAAAASDWGPSAVQRILISQGDLCRYLTDTDPDSYPPALAARYYHQALLVGASAGRPHNQLGTLAGSSVLHGLQATFHYLRAISCDEPFAAARQNIAKLLQKNHDRRTDLDMEHGNSGVTPCRRLVVSFLDVIYGATLMENPKQHRLVRLCQETLQWLSYCLQQQKPSAACVTTSSATSAAAGDGPAVLSTSRPTCPSSSAASDAGGNGGQLSMDPLEPTSALLMVAVVILAMEIVPKDAVSASALRAFLLATFSCLVNRVTDRLTNRLPSLACVSSPLANRNGSSTQAPPTVAANGKRSDMRRRRALNNGDANESDDEDVRVNRIGRDGITNGKLSAAEDTDESCCDLSSSDEDDVEADGDHLGGSLNGQQRGVVTASQLIEAFKEEGMWSPLRVCCDWLRANDSVLRQCTENSGSLWKQLALLGNAISQALSAPLDTVEGVRAEFGRAGGVSQLAGAAPLWEDRLLRGVGLLATRHQLIHWNQPNLQKLTSTEQALLRSQLVLDFCVWLSGIRQLGLRQEPGGRFTHVTSALKNGAAAGAAEDASVTILKQNGDAPPTGHQAHCQTENGVVEGNGTSAKKNGETRQKTLMSNMAELWLRSEVRSLRARTGRRAGQPDFSPYLVPDASALTAHLSALKQLTKARQFVLVVPAAVIHELDERKSECVGAREASRWLEDQFRRGNRSLRPQRAHEKSCLQMVKYPRRKEKQQWRFFQMLECCYHLASTLPTPPTVASGTNGSSTDPQPGGVTLLLGDALKQQGAGEFSPAALAAAAGIHCEQVVTFHSKWAVSSKGRS